MVNRVVLVKVALAAILMVAVFGLVAPAAMAQEHGAEVAVSGGEGSGLRTLGIGLGAGLAVGLAGLATGNAQAGVGAGGTGAMAEKPELFTNVLILFAIPETVVVFGFVIAIMLVGKI